MKNSKLQRLYINTENQIPAEVKISDVSKVHYMRNVLRFRLNDKIRIFNEFMGEYEAKVTLCDKKEINLEILNNEHHRKPFICRKLSIAPAIIKNDKFADMLDSATQQGATNIIPLITNFTNNRKVNKERLERIIEEASEQSERFDIPSISDPINLVQIDYSSYDAVIFANEKDQKNSFDSKIFEKENILLITGPEGGFSDDEIEFLDSLSNSYSISLGPRILRAETAINSLITNVNFVRG